MGQFALRIIEGEETEREGGLGDNDEDCFQIAKIAANREPFTLALFARTGKRTGLLKAGSQVRCEAQKRSRGYLIMQ